MTTHRAISIRAGELRYDISAPVNMRVGEAIAQIGLPLSPTTRLIHERGGVAVAAESSVSGLNDGDVLSVITPHTSARKRRGAQRRADARLPTSRLAAPWWLLGVAATAATILFAVTPSARPQEPWSWGTAVLAVAAVIAGFVVLSRRTSATDPTLLPAMLGPAAVLAATGVLVSPPDTFSPAVTVVTACALISGYLALAGILARGMVARAQASTLAILTICIGAVYALVAVIDAPATAAAAIIVGATPIVLRALPASIMDVPAGMFIDFERYQQTRWSVRENLPEPVVTVDRDRVAGLVARSHARLLTATSALIAGLAVLLPLAVNPLPTDRPVEMWGRMVLLVLLMLAFGLGSRHHSSHTLRYLYWAGGGFSAAVAAWSVYPLISAPLVPVVAATLLVVVLLVVIAIIPLSRGARSLFWSRFGDMIESVAVVLSLPAGLVATGTIDAIRGWMY